VGIDYLFVQDSREVFRLEEWIIQGAIIGMGIGSLIGLTGDSFVNFIDSLIKRSTTPPLTEDIPPSPEKQSRSGEPDVSTEEIEKRILEDIEPVLPVKRWKKEMREQEEKRGKQCDDMLQEWNSLCQWFNDNWQQKVELDNQERNLHKMMYEIRYVLIRARHDLNIRSYVRTGAFLTGIASALCGLGEFASVFSLGEGASLFGTAGVDGVATHVGLSAYETGERVGGEPTFEERELAELDKGTKQIMELRKQILDKINGKRNRLKGEYMKNRERLRQLEKLMRRDKCERIPPDCQSADAPQWMWVRDGKP
jgi:hypothetical protein